MRKWPRVVRRAGGALLAVLVLLAVVYNGYVAYEASRRAVDVDEYKSRDCATPDVTLGWSYDAINYPKADDAALRAANPDMGSCSTQGVPAGNEVVTSDGIRIAGWYIPAADGSGPTSPTVVLLHGYSGDKSGMPRYGYSLHAHYNLVAFDMRNGGRSSGTQTTMGVKEAYDLRAIIDWLEKTKHPRHIGVMGVSMGAAAAITEARRDPRIEAMVLDSMHTRIVYQFEQRLEQAGHPAYPGTWDTFLGTWLRTGVNFSDADPMDALPDMGSRPILLIHGTADTQDLPARTQAFYEAAVKDGLHIQLRWCDGAGHGATPVVDHCRDAYRSWVSTFFDSAFA